MGGSGRADGGEAALQVIERQAIERLVRNLSGDLFRRLESSSGATQEITLVQRELLRGGRALYQAADFRQGRAQLPCRLPRLCRPRRPLRL